MADVTQLKTRITMTQKKADLLLASAERDQRALTDEEKQELTALEKELDGLAARIAQTESDAAMMTELDRIRGGPGRPRPSASTHGKSWGEIFVAATADFFKQGGHRTPGAWSSPAAIVPLLATTITEDPASGGALVLPDVPPGIVPLPERQLHVADIFAAGTTSSNTIRLMVEKTFTNAAGAVLEATAKPESALVFQQQDEPVRKFAHWIPATEELLEDAPTARSYIDGRLRLGIQLAEDDELLNGSGVAPHILGILHRTGLTATITQTTETIADVIAAQLAAVAMASSLPPDAVVINPTDWLKLLTTKDTTGRYLSDNAPFVTVTPPTIWGVPAVLTVAIAVKTILVAAGKMGGQVFRHTGGVRVEASNSHQDFFTKNLVAIRAEERVALAVYRPSGFGIVTLA